MKKQKNVRSRVFLLVFTGMLFAASGRTAAANSGDLDASPGESADVPSCGAMGDGTTGDDALCPKRGRSVVTYEAEDVDEMFGVSVEEIESGFTGSGYADFGGAESYIKWTQVFADEGDATLIFRYANGAPDIDRSTELYVNGVQVDLITWPGTPKGWKVWKTQECNVTLQSGYNTIELRQTTSGGPNIDRVTITSGGVVEITAVPDVVGLSQAQARLNIMSAGLVVGTVTMEYSSTVAAGVVIRQTPTGGSSVAAGSPVNLVVSRGTHTIG